MNKAELIAKTINNKKGYKYYAYETEYKDDIVIVYHYGTNILEFSIEKPFNKGEYVKLGGGYSTSDKTMIDICLSHIRDFTCVEYWRLSKSYVFTPKGKIRKYYKTHYTIVDENDVMVIVKPKPFNQYTLYAYPPYVTYVNELKQLIEKKRHEFRLNMYNRLNELFDYLKSFTTDFRLKFDPNKGYIVNLDNAKYLISFCGDVIDLQNNQYVCVQPHGYGSYEVKDNPVDLMITKALGIINKPNVLKEGIRYKVTNINSDPLHLVKGKLDNEIREIEDKIKEFNETLTYDYYQKPRSYNKHNRYDRYYYKINYMKISDFF
jgi:hypothetical protein